MPVAAHAVESGSESPKATGRPRVVHVVRSYGEVSEAFVADGVRAIDDAGWESWVATTSVKHRDLFPFPPNERVRLGELPPPSRRALDRLTLRSSADRRSRALLPAIAAGRPALVHAQFGWGAADARLAARCLGLPLVATFHGSDLTIFPGYRRLYRDYRKLFRELRRAVCVSEFLADRLRGYGYSGKIEIVPSGIHLDEFPFRGGIPPADPTRLLFVGRQIPCKAVDTLIRALGLAIEDESDLVLEVVGDGPCRTENEALARDLGLARRLTWHGTQSRAGVLAALRRSHLFVMPSRTAPNGQTEGLGNVTVEALAAGVPVVATASGGIPESLPPQHRDELVPPDDSRALADRIVGLVRARDTWASRALRGRRWVEERFDWGPLASRMTAIYDEVAEEAARPSRNRPAGRD